MFVRLIVRISVDWALRFKIKSKMKIYTLDVVVLHKYPGNSFFFVEVDSRMMVGQLDLDVPVADLALDLNYC